MLAPKIAIGLFLVGAGILVPSLAASDRAASFPFGCGTSNCKGGDCSVSGVGCTCYCAPAGPYCSCKS